MIPHLTYFHGLLQVSFNGPVAAKLIEAEFLPAWPEAQAQADSSKAQWQQRQQQQQQVGPALTAQHQQQLQVGPPPLAQHQQQQQTEPPPPVVNYFHQQQQQQMQWGPAFQQLQQQMPPDFTQQLQHGEAHASAAADGLVDGLPEGISLQGGLDPLPPGSSIEDYQDWNRTVGEAVASGSVSKKVRRVQGKQRKIPASELHAINLTRPVETPFEEVFFWELYDRFTVKGVTKWDLMAAVSSWRAKQLRARGNFHVSEKTANQLKQHMHKLVLANLRRTAVAGGGQQTGPSMNPHSINPPSINPIAAPTMNAPADSALPHEEQLFNSSSRQMQCHDHFTSVAARQPNNSASQLNYNVQPQHGSCVTFVLPAYLPNVPVQVFGNMSLPAADQAQKQRWQQQPPLGQQTGQGGQQQQHQQHQQQQQPLGQLQGQGQQQQRRKKRKEREVAGEISRLSGKPLKADKNGNQGGAEKKKRCIFCCGKYNEQMTVLRTDPIEKHHPDCPLCKNKLETQQKKRQR